LTSAGTTSESSVGAKKAPFSMICDVQLRLTFSLQNLAKPSCITSASTFTWGLPLSTLSVQWQILLMKSWRKYLRMFWVNFRFDREGRLNIDARWSNRKVISLNSLRALLMICEENRFYEQLIGCALLEIQYFTERMVSRQTLLERLWPSLDKRLLPNEQYQALQRFSKTMMYWLFRLLVFLAIVHQVFNNI